jgi:uncharacterized membrane protein HdeD (DUF308 family)
MNAMNRLVRHRWMMVVRGALAGAFGLLLLAWPGITLPIVVVLFAGYAMADGAWAIVAATRVSARRFDAWPVALEGAVGTVLGVIALAWPLRIPRELVVLIVVWGIVTGVLELIAAAGIARDTAGRWLLATGGFTSLFLALLVLMLPHADVETIARLMGAYALVFGVAMILATVGVDAGGPRTAPMRPRI